MMATASALLNRLAPAEVVSRRAGFVIGLVAILHGGALAAMAATESDWVAKVAFLLVWGLLNCFWLVLLRRPLVAALLSLEFIVALILLSRFKFDKLWMTVDFVDLMIVDRDTSAFLLAAFPSLRGWIAFALVVTAALVVLAWRFDPARVRRRSSLAGGALCLAALAMLSLSFPTGLREDFVSEDYVSKFARTGVEAIDEFATHGYLQSDASAAEKLGVPPVTCAPARKLPHIILLHDESSFDITMAPGIKVPEGYGGHFLSSDGKARKLIVDGAGGPSWFTEYNVLTGLSARSYGRFATSVTRIAAGRVYRGLPRSLSRCGYNTFSLYPFYGAFLGSRAFQTTTGIAHYMDMADLGTHDFEADRFYYDQALKIVERERARGPLFLYVYTVANHFPWDTRLRPELTPDWRSLGNGPEVDEYIRRQQMSVQDYRGLLARLARDFPAESFLIVRYGDHQPGFGPRLLSPSLGSTELARQLEALNPRYFTTYYAVDSVNFTPADLSSARDTLEASYLPLVIEEAAGVPLDPAFAEQRKILKRCDGLFFRCLEGAEAKRFNRMLLDAGLIKGM
jgi:Sulfatase